MLIECDQNGKHVQMDIFWNIDDDFYSTQISVGLFWIPPPLHINDNWRILYWKPLNHSQVVPRCYVNPSSDLTIDFNSPSSDLARWCLDPSSDLASDLDVSRKLPALLNLVVQLYLACLLTLSLSLSLSFLYLASSPYVRIRSYGRAGKQLSSMFGFALQKQPNPYITMWMGDAMLNQPGCWGSDPCGGEGSGRNRHCSSLTAAIAQHKLNKVAWVRNLGRVQFENVTTTRHDRARSPGRGRTSLQGSNVQESSLLPTDRVQRYNEHVPLVQTTWV